MKRPLLDKSCKRAEANLAGNQLPSSICVSVFGFLAGLAEWSRGNSGVCLFLFFFMSHLLSSLMRLSYTESLHRCCRAEGLTGLRQKWQYLRINSCFLIGGY